MDVDQPSVGRVPVAPDPFEQHLTGEDLPRFASQAQQQVELQGRQGDDLVVAPDAVPGDVDSEVGDGDDLRGVVGQLANPRPDAGNQLLGFEWLDDIVVG